MSWQTILDDDRQRRERALLEFSRQRETEKRGKRGVVLMCGLLMALIAVAKLAGL